jgi:membrane-bound serine protease (ClpP class)
MIRKFILFLCLAWVSAGTGAEQPGLTLLLDIKGSINPATSDYIVRSLEEAMARRATLVVLQMDTPGGLDSAMRDIIRAILASTVPVVTYVAPSGARAASAGTYILYASHIAAMAPGTNVGAATPVQIGGIPTPTEPWPTGKKDKDNQDKDRQKEDQPEHKDSMTQKLVNDAVAYLRGLAELRGRNPDWAEQAVRQAASLSASKALELNVVDLIAEDVPALLEQLNGRLIEIQGEQVQLNTENLRVEALEPDWRSKLLAVITDPNVAYILMLLGIYGLFFELSNPGYVLPGVVGGICLLLALYAFQVLPVNYAGLGLIILGIAFMIGEVFMPSFGALGIGGILAFVIGSVILVESGAQGYSIALPLIISVALFSAAFFIGVITFAFRVHRRPVVTGQEEMIGLPAEALEDFQGIGRVRAHGELWRAQTRTPLHRGQKLRVTGIEGLTLTVEPDTHEKEEI